MIWSWPQTRATRHEVLARLLAAPFALGNALSQQTRRQGLVTVVSWLESQPGDTWQERWAASGAEAAPDWRDLVACWRSGRAGGTGPGAHRPRAARADLRRCDPARAGVAVGVRAGPQGPGRGDGPHPGSAAFAELAAMCERNAVGGQPGRRRSSGWR